MFSLPGQSAAEHGLVERDDQPVARGRVVDGPVDRPTAAAPGLVARADFDVGLAIVLDRIPFEHARRRLFEPGAARRQESGQLETVGHLGMKPDGHAMVVVPHELLEFLVVARQGS